VIGCLLIVVPFSTTPVLRQIERASPTLDVELGVLRGNRLFAMLSAPALEDLARAMNRVEVTAGDTIIRQGEHGDGYFLIASGLLDVAVDGSHVQTLAPGDGFGEIALLRDGLRTATVYANSSATLYALDRAPFLEAVTGSPQADRTARALAAERLG
jgi:CRP-like cAMP-binding protein